MKTAKLYNYIDVMTKKEYDKQYYQANKERKKANDKQYHLNNPEYQQQWYLNNKKHKQEYEIEYHKLLTLPYYIIYLLPDYNYVGITNNPTYRMRLHKSQRNRNTDNWIELARYENKEEALAHEARLHDTGYEGGKVCYNITQEA